jgi:hypothetical protein
VSFIDPTEAAGFEPIASFPGYAASARWTPGYEARTISVLDIERGMVVTEIVPFTPSRERAYRDAVAGALRRGVERLRLAPLLLALAELGDLVDANDYLYAAARVPEPRAGTPIPARPAHWR